MELQCYHCKSGRAILDGGDFICDNCGAVLETPEEYTSSHPFFNKIASADTDAAKKYTSYPKDRHKHIQEEMDGSRTVAHIVKDEERQAKTSSIDHKAIKIRNEQKEAVKFAIDDITEELGLRPGKVLSRFESYLKRVGLNDILKTDNVITNKGHKRGSNVVAAAIIYKVYRNNITIRKLKKAAGCGNKPLQKVLSLIT